MPNEADDVFLRNSLLSTNSRIKRNSLYERYKAKQPYIVMQWNFERHLKYFWSQAEQHHVTLYPSAHNHFKTKIGPDDILSVGETDTYICRICQKVIWLEFYDLHFMMHVVVFGVWPGQSLAVDTMLLSEQYELGIWSSWFFSQCLSSPSMIIYWSTFDRLHQCFWFREIYRQNRIFPVDVLNS